MKIKSHLFITTPSGVSERSHEGTTGSGDALSQLIIFCDVLSIKSRPDLPTLANADPLSSEDSATLGALIDRWIREYLVREASSIISEQTLTLALEYANNRLLQSDVPHLMGVAISTTVIAPVKNEECMLCS